MIHFKLTKKNVKRLVTTMLLIAPIVYLFGALFTGLNGAHGQQIFADGEETLQKSYDELMEVDNFSYGAFDWTNEHGTRLGFSLGRLYYLSNSSEKLFSCTSNGVSFSSTDFDSVDFGLGFSCDLDSPYFSFLCAESVGFDDYAYFGDDEYYTCFYFIPYSSTTSSFLDIYAFVYFGNNEVGISNAWFGCTWNSITSSYGDWELIEEDGDGYGVDDRLDWFVYFDDGAHLPAGVSWNDELRSYFVPSVKATEQQTYSDYVFGQFFARDNFVSDIGKDVLSDDPHGFVPFAAMIKFVDENMLNIGSLQVGLMAYGYFYWCAHVLLLMVLFDLTTFFITWVSHIGDKFGGNADE